MGNIPVRQPPARSPVRARQPEGTERILELETQPSGLVVCEVSLGDEEKPMAERPVCSVADRTPSRSSASRKSKTSELWFPPVSVCVEIQDRNFSIENKGNRAGQTPAHRQAGRRCQNRGHPAEGGRYEVKPWGGDSRSDRRRGHRLRDSR